MKLMGKVMVVTGGGNGIGRELVFSLLSKGAIVVALDRDEAALKETQQKSGVGENRFVGYPVDITDPVAVSALPDRGLSSFGRIDGLINNAGIIQKFMAVEDFTMDQIRRIMDVNFFGTLTMVKAFLPHLKRRDESVLVNVSSMGGFLPVPLQTIYGASKAAVKILTEGLQAELRKSSVHVILVMPGGVSTGIMTTAGIDTTKLMSSKIAKTYRMLTPKGAAQRIIRSIEHNGRRVILGIDAKAMDFLYRISPRLATAIMTKMLDVDRYL